MKMLRHFIFCFLFLFNAYSSGYSQNDRRYQTVYFGVNDRTSFIDDAEVYVNGVRSTYKPGYGYGLDTSLHPPFHISVQHKGYLPLEYDHLNYFSELYLIRDGEDYYCTTGGIKCPIIKRRDLMYVIGGGYSAQGKILDPDSVQSQLKIFLEENGMEIFYSFNSYNDTLKKYHMFNVQKNWGYDYSYCFLVCRSDHRDFDEVSPELGLLRTCNFIQYAGPVLLRSDDYHNSPIAYSNKVQVVFDPQVSDTSVKRLLSEAGCPNAEICNIFPRVFCCEVPAETGMQMNSILESLQNLKDIAEIDPQMIGLFNSVQIDQ